MKVINLFAGPGAGKSTTAAGLFFFMKLAGRNVELVTEVAKDATWEEHHFLLGDQYAITGEQNRRLSRLIGKVDYVITDSPLLLGLAYLPENYVPSFPRYLQELFMSYDNINFWINRIKPYNKVGRNQTAEEAAGKDLQILGFMNALKLNYTSVDGNAEAPLTIMRQILGDHNE